ncbi:MAG: phosphate/phosphite/phosphonate ABC transporter substrate-binding protein [Desulfobacterales bacterium]|jgi:phosphonate transport system substrate-binding protein
MGYSVPQKTRKYGHCRRRVLWVAQVVVIGFFLLITACSGEETALPIDMSIREDVALLPATGQVLKYAYLPQFSHAVSFQRHHLLIRHIEKQTGLRIRQVFPDTFDEHMRMVGQGSIDISFSNPFIYVRMAEAYCTRAFARVIEENGRERFRGEIIARADNPDVQHLADSVGKRWIAVDPASAGGYLYPLGHFLAHGIQPSDFSEIAFAPGPGGKQEKVILAVFAGQYDIGSVREGALDVVADKIDRQKIRVLDRTQWYPGWVFAARRDLAADTIALIAKALTMLDDGRPEHLRLLQNAHMTGIIPSTDRDFDTVRRLWAQVGDAQHRCAAPGDRQRPAERGRPTQ